MKKLIVKLVVVGVLVLIVGVAAAAYYIDSLAKAAIEFQASSALGVETTLESANIGILDGKFAMSGLTVANPKGFEAGDHFMKLGEGGIEVSLGTLMEDRIVVPELVLSGIDLVLEKKGDKANYEVIMEHLGKDSGEAEDPPAEEGEEGKEFVVEKILIKDISVTAYVIQIGSQAARPVKVNIPQIEMTYSSKDGATIQDLTELIMQTILTAVVNNAGELLPGMIVDGLTEGLEQLPVLADAGVAVVVEAAKVVGVVGEEVGKVLEAVGKDGGKVIEGVGKAVEDVGKGVGKEVGKGLEEVGKGLDGLFGKDKKK